MAKRALQKKSVDIRNQIDTLRAGVYRRRALDGGKHCPEDVAIWHDACARELRIAMDALRKFVICADFADRDRAKLRDGGAQ